MLILLSNVIRVWYGTAYRKDANKYGRHVKNDIFPLFSEMKGNLGAKVLKRDVEEGVEFMVMTIWDSMESIKEFGKDDMEKAVVAKVARPLFIRYDNRVSHFIVESELG
jgi:heme-degrading monooxygenase HmoA